MAWNSTAKRMGVVLWISLFVVALSITGIGILSPFDEGQDRIGPVIPTRTELSSFSFLLPLGIRNTSRRELFENRSRRSILRCVTANPGIGFRELARKSGISTGALRYHLDKLSIRGMVSQIGSAEGIAIFPGMRIFSPLEQRVIKNLRSPTRNLILRRLREKYACTRNDLALHVGISTSGISWHMKKLTKEEIVVREKEGRATVYRLAEGIRDLFGP